MRESVSFTISPDFKTKLLQWAKKFKRICVLDSNNEYQDIRIKNREYDLIAGIDAIDEITHDKNCFNALKIFYDWKKDWLFGYFSYDLKNELEKLSSDNFDGLHLPLMHFFQPKYIFKLKHQTVEIAYLPSISDQEEINDLMAQIEQSTLVSRPLPPVPSLKSRISSPQYIETVNQIKEHIQVGDVYEINFCQEFYAENAVISPAEIFEKLNAISHPPFAAFYRMDDKYLMCASPERFVKKTGSHVISQPIKGTRRRGGNAEEDEYLKKQLYLDEKERCENVMIVDLVRNDLSKTAKRGSVKVDELFGIYTFSQVHQMISTISSEVKPGVHWIEIIQSLFPMGSMTGAPKIRAMELIENYESTKRGLYSGSVGYVTPDGDFDFNVVIRSILYNASLQYLSFMVGGAITHFAVAEQEYEECLVKAKAMFEVLGVKKIIPD